MRHLLRWRKSQLRRPTQPNPPHGRATVRSPHPHAGLARGPRWQRLRSPLAASRSGQTTLVSKGRGAGQSGTFSGCASSNCGDPPDPTRPTAGPLCAALTPHAGLARGPRWQRLRAAARLGPTVLVSKGRGAGRYSAPAGLRGRAAPRRCWATWAQPQLEVRRCTLH